MSVLVFVFSVIGSSVLAFIVGIIFGVLCGVSYRQKSEKATLSKQIPCTEEENSMRSIKGPEYEEVELEDKPGSIGLSRNVAYEYIKKT